MNDFLFSSVNDKTDYDVIQENHRYISLLSHQFICYHFCVLGDEYEISKELNRRVIVSFQWHVMLNS